MTIPPPSLKDFLVRFLAILNTNPANLDSMILEVEQLAHLATVTALLKKLPNSLRQTLNQKIAGQEPTKQTRLIAEQLTHTFSQDEYLTAANQTLQEIIPDYIARLAESATPKQRQEIENLIQNLT